jgi:gamma-glutamylcyclotransferase (GGCT)/AIG2-like uncharacterized protein YtfP
MPFSDNDFPAWPYPGTRPGCSFVHDDGVGWPLRSGPGSGWRWALTDTGDDLDEWLATRDAPPLAARIPVLAYGSNADPATMTWLREHLGLRGPVVALRVSCDGLAAVWAMGRHVVDTRPATLVAAPGRVEWHAVWLATAEQAQVLDVRAGRDVWYRLVRLDSGTVTTEDGIVLPGVLAYTGVGTERAPMLVDGAVVRCADVPQAVAGELVGEAGPDDGLTVTPVVGTPSPDEWPNHLFVYGTLRPDSSAWHLLRPYVVGEPVAAWVAGALYDTGRGYPAFCRGADEVPGWTVTLRSPAAALAALDEYEGEEYRRVRVVDSGGRLCWVYLWVTSMVGLRPLAGRWAD